MNSHPPAPTDRPEEDPNVQAVGFDVTALTPAEFERHGIRLEPNIVTVTKADPAWISHSSQSLYDPTMDAMERSYARRAAYDHLAKQRKKGVKQPTLEGLVLRRSFPCTGQFRHTEWSGRVRLVQCDKCGTEIGVSYED